MKKINIAIDGYSSCGKSTLAKDLAKHLAYIFVDTGSMYRAITLFYLRKKEAGEITTWEEVIPFLPSIKLEFVLNPSTNTPEIVMNEENISLLIRDKVINDNVSPIAALKEVRAKLVYEQQQIGLAGGVVMDGRDIGTVVFPHAELKLFITADIDTRTQRRYAELESMGKKTNYDEVKENLLSRDYMDMNRAESPLRQAEDALVIDNTNLTKDEQLKLALQLVSERTTL